MPEVEATFPGRAAAIGYLQRSDGHLLWLHAADYPDEAAAQAFSRECAPGLRPEQ